MPSTLINERVEATPDAAEAPLPSRRRTFGSPPSMATLVAALLAFVAWSFQLRPLRDNSFLTHLKAGHWILDHGIPRGDVFSFTAPGTDWVVQSWFADVIYALLDQAFGPFGIRVLRAVTAVLVVWLVYRLALRLTRNGSRAVLLTLAAVTASFTLWVERPLFFGILAMVVLLWIVEVPDSLVGRHPYVSLPLLMWAWINVHGSFALGFAYLALHVAGRWLDGSPPWQGRERRLVQATLGALALCLVNPFGVSLLTFPLHLLSRGEVLKEIKEWKSPDFQGVYGICFLVWVIAFVVSLASARGRYSRRDLLVSVPFLLLGFWALRNVALAPLVGLPVVARALAVERERPERRLSLNWVVLALIVLLGLVAAVDATGEADYALDGYPVEAMQMVERSGLLGQELLTTEAWGAYVVHEYWPRQHVFMDDRYDMFPIALIEEYFALGRADRGWDGILDRHGIDVVVWDIEKPLTQLLDHDARWQRIHRDDLAAVWVRRAGQA